MSLFCYNNLIKDEAMDALIGSLPVQNSANLHVIDLSYDGEKNICTKTQVELAKEKGWKVWAVDANGGDYKEYEGSEPTGIQNITLDKETKAPIYNLIYNLNGERVETPQKGINIINGKKVVMK